MRFVPFTTVVMLAVLPLTALGQSYSNAPLIAVHGGSVVGGPAAAPAESTPQAEQGIQAVAAASDEAPKAPEPKAAPVPASPAAPASPASPPSPPSKLWPRDTAAIFVTSCSKLRANTIQPCRCIINRLMNEMLHDEFMRLSDGDLIANDPRYLSIRDACIAASKQQQQEQQKH